MLFLYGCCLLACFDAGLQKANARLARRSEVKSAAPDVVVWPMELTRLGAMAALTLHLRGGCVSHGKTLEQHSRKQLLLS